MHLNETEAETLFHAVDMVLGIIPEDTPEYEELLALRDKLES